MTIRPTDVINIAELFEDRKYSMHNIPYRYRVCIIFFLIKIFFTIIFTWQSNIVLVHDMVHLHYFSTKVATCFLKSGFYLITWFSWKEQFTFPPKSPCIAWKRHVLCWYKGKWKWYDWISHMYKHLQAWY